MSNLLFFIKKIVDHVLNGSYSVLLIVTGRGDSYYSMLARRQHHDPHDTFPIYFLGVFFKQYFALEG